MSIIEKVIIGNATLYLGECQAIAANLPKPAAIITDPPYGIGFQHGGNAHGGGIGSTSQGAKNNTKTEKIIGDDKPFDPTWMLDKMGTKAPKIILFGANYYARKLPDNNAGDWLVWDKCPRGGANNSFRDTEYIWSSVKSPRTIYRHHWQGCLREGEEASSKQIRVHVSQKPVALMMWCIETLRVPIGGVILDPYMGSGSTGVAALRKGHDFIGIEIDRKHFETACKRINAELNARSQAPLGNAVGEAPASRVGKLELPMTAITQEKP